MALPLPSNTLVSLGTLILSVFLAGSFFGGDWRYRQELKAEIKEIKAEQATMLQQVKEVNEKYQREQVEFNRKTLEFYKTLDDIASQKGDVVKKIKELGPKIDAQIKKTEFEVAVLEKLLDNDQIGLENKNF